MLLRLAFWLRLALLALLLGPPVLPLLAARPAPYAFSAWMVAEFAASLRLQSFGACKLLLWLLLLRPPQTPRRPTSVTFLTSLWAQARGGSSLPVQPWGASGRPHPASASDCDAPRMSMDELEAVYRETAAVIFKPESYSSLLRSV